MTTLAVAARDLTLAQQNRRHSATALDRMLIAGARLLVAAAVVREQHRPSRQLLQYQEASAEAQRVQQAGRLVGNLPR